MTWAISRQHACQHDGVARGRSDASRRSDAVLVPPGTVTRGRRAPCTTNYVTNAKA